jgi:hypothetical protein
LGIQTDTDLIIELVKFDSEVIYETNIYKNSKGKEGTLKSPFRYYGVEIEFKLILIKNNEFAGSYRYFYAPCESGCLVDKGLEDFFKFKKKREIRYKAVEKSELEGFTIRVTNDLIKSLKQ